MDKENIALICECGSGEHLLIVRKDIEDENNFYLEIHLTKFGFWERLKYGLKYIFGYQCKYGAFDEIILSKARLHNVLKEFAKESVNV